MIGIQGTIALSTLNSPGAVVPVGKIIQRTDELDSALERAGFDPERVNVASTPLIGASRHAEITVLAFMQPQSVGSDRAFDYANAQSILNGSADILYSIILNEPYAGSTGGGGGGDKPPPPPGPDIDIGEGGVFPDGGEGEVAPPDIVPGDSPSIARLAATTTAPTNQLLAFQFGRQMRWNNLTLVHAQELTASVAGYGIVTTNPAFPPPGGSVFLLRFVDARARFLGQTVWSAVEGMVPSGTIRDQWNMIAENPLHLVASTVKTSTYYPPSLNPSSVIPSGYPIPPGSLDVSKMLGIPAPSPWYSEAPYTAAEIISAYVAQSAYALLDRRPISYSFLAAAGQYERPGDMLNLDLRGRTIGECLDEIAGRIGCAWYWDRYLSRLTLRPIISGLPNGPAGGANVPLFNLFNSAFRAGGGLNEVPNEMPGRWATVHPVRYASVWGTLTGSDSEVYVDWRSMSSADGVQTLNLQTSDRPPLWYQIGTGTGRTQFVGDHLPAYYGSQSDEPNTPDWMATVPAPQDDYTIWNREQAGVLSAWWQKPWATGLTDRLQVIQERYRFAGQIIDGDMVLNRLPAYGSVTPMMTETPSAGLQHDEVRFGLSSVSVQYRIFGSNTDSILFPHLIRPDRVKAMNLGTAYQASGCVNLQRINRRGGIVRTFLVRFSKYEVLKRVQGYDAVWLYRIEEAYPLNIVQPSWDIGGDWGQPAVRGYALNLCEIDNPLDPFPQFNFDGGMLNYDATTDEPVVTKVSPAGIAPCYEYVAPTGYTVYFIYASNGVQVECAAAAPIPLSPAWQNSGASGAAFASSSPLSASIGFTDSMSE